tara:strand:+ start:71 stop:271 length:201 start_codon:yes stop_codon:yes gene_type:complete
VHSLQEVQPIADRLAKATADTLDIEAQSVSISLAIGITLAKDSACELGELIAEVDQSMYRVKNSRT